MSAVQFATDQVLAKVRPAFVAHLDRANDLQSTLSK
jgi:hypothetical protein